MIQLCMGYGMRGRREEAVQKRYKIGTFIPGIFGGDCPFQIPRKTLTDFVIFLYSVMFSRDKMLAVYKPSPIRSHLAKYIFLTCILLRQILLSLNISICWYCIQHSGCSQ